MDGDAGEDPPLPAKEMALMGVRFDSSAVRWSLAPEQAARTARANCITFAGRVMTSWNQAGMVVILNHMGQSSSTQ